MPKVEAIEAGQAVYSPLVLKIYDWFVLGFSNRVLWRCPTPALRALYGRNVSARHIDIGVGTGYFLDKVNWPVPNPAITLVDLNPNSLDAAARRIARYAPRTVAANALAPLPPLGPFDSAGLCYLLHCLPGAIAEKAAVFDHLRPALAPGARVFGATILQGDAPRSWAAQRLMNLYNKKGIFSNAHDTRHALDAALKQRFSDVKIEMRGAVALFEARKG
jgi:SAM-dependent methyltransferase